MFPSLLDVNSIISPFWKPSTHSIFISAPSIAFPVVTSVLLNSTVPVILSFFNSTFTTSFSFTSNIPTSSFKTNPSGAIVSLNSYFPTGSLNLLFSLLDTNSNLI